MYRKSRAGGAGPGDDDRRANGKGDRLAGRRRNGICRFGECLLEPWRKPAWLLNDAALPNSVTCIIYLASF
jgi:hypothetical protein